MHLIVFIPVILLFAQKINYAKKRFDAEYEGHLIMYLVTREHVVCPRCASVYAVQTLEEQMNTKWDCSECGCAWEETPTHDIKGVSK